MGLVDHKLKMNPTAVLREARYRTEFVDLVLILPVSSRKFRDKQNAPAMGGKRSKAKPPRAKQRIRIGKGNFKKPNIWNII